MKMGRAALAGMALMIPGLAYADFENFDASIWVDPDGCQHWYIDDGVEGYMDPVYDRDGNPVCTNICAVLDVELFFEVDSVEIREDAAEQIEAFFAALEARGQDRIAVIGHADELGPDGYNQALSDSRAAAVAALARGTSLDVLAIGRGESEPRAANTTPEGRALNRRVEITCE